MAGFAALVAIWLIAGCSSRAELHEALKLTPEQIEKAKTRARSLISSGGDSSRTYETLMQEMNLRISGNVILRKAAACWPQRELVVQIAQQGDDSDAGLQRAAEKAVKRLERQLKFVVTVEIPTGRDPADITFAMQTDPGSVEYPPISVSAPVHLRDYASALDPTAPPAGLWWYEMWFPIAGSPGYPAISPDVSSLCLVVRDGEGEAKAWFPLPRAQFTG